MEMLSAWLTVATGLLESFAVAVKLKVPLAVGVPEIVPEAVAVPCKLKPVGRLPVVTLHVTGNVPPLAATV
jgi:hypothetical protein